MDTLDCQDCGDVLVELDPEQAAHRARDRRTS